MDKILKGCKCEVYTDMEDKLDGVEEGSGMDQHSSRVFGSFIER